MRPWTEVALILVVAATLFFSNLGTAKLWDRDEPRNAGCAKEMLERGDLIVPVFNNEIRTAKPVLLYWLIISAYEVFGVNEFAARFWSALLALGTVACTYLIGQRLFSHRVGLIAAIVLSTSLMFDVAARAATPDSALIFFSTLSLALFVRGVFHRKDPGVSEQQPTIAHVTLVDRWPVAAAMYLAMAFGVLAKGPIGFLMPTAIIGMYLLWIRLPENETQKDAESTRQRIKTPAILRAFAPLHFLRTCFAMRLVTATALILIVAGPWYLMVGLQTDGEFLRSFFLKEHLGRSTTAFENHSGSIFYYPLAMCVGFFPWSVFALPILFSLWTYRHRTPPAITFLCCWIAVQVGIFSLVQTKLPSYVTPCYPALALLVAFHLRQWQLSPNLIPKGLPRVSLITLTTAGAAITIGIAIAAVQILDLSPWLAVVGLFPVATGILAWRYWGDQRDNKSQRSIPILLTGASCFAFCFFSVILPQVSARQTYDEVLCLDEQAGLVVGSYGVLEPSWVFYGNRPIYELSLGTPLTNSLPWSSDQASSRDWRPKPNPALESFIAQQNHVVLTRASQLPGIESALGRKVSVLERTRYFLKDDEIVLIELAPILSASKAKRDKHR